MINNLSAAQSYFVNVIMALSQVRGGPLIIQGEGWFFFEKKNRSKHCLKKKIGPSIHPKKKSVRAQPPKKKKSVQAPKPILSLYPQC